MAEIIYDCPHCGAGPVGMHPLFQAPSKRSDKQTIYNHVTTLCRACQDPVLFVLKHANLGRGLPDPMNYSGDPTKQGWSIHAVYPSPAPSIAPEHIPPGVRKAFLQGEASLRGRHWDAAGAMFRKALDLATKDKAPDPKFKTLKTRIDHLASTHAITPGLQTLAHGIRDIGNEAAHDDFDEPDARSIFRFTELFLTYVYTLPHKVAESAAAAPTAAAAPAVKT